MYFFFLCEKNSGWEVFGLTVCEVEEGASEEKRGTSGTNEILVLSPVKVAIPELIRLLVTVFRKIG